MKVWIVRRLARAVIAVALLAGTVSHAQSPELAREQVGYLTLEASPRYRSELQRLSLAAVTLIPRLERDLGQRLTGPVRIVIASVRQ